MRRFECSGCGWCCKNFVLKLPIPESAGCGGTVSVLNPLRPRAFPINEYDFGRLKANPCFESESVAPSAGIYDSISGKTLVVAWTFVDSSCRYYDNGCTIYENRPSACRAYPLLDSNRNGLRPLVGHCPAVLPEQVEFAPSSLDRDGEFGSFLEGAWGEQYDEERFGREFLARTIDIACELDAKGVIKPQAEFPGGGRTSECVPFYKYAQSHGWLPGKFLDELVNGRYGQLK
ncbi:MAG: hypothetical protein CVT48_04625 [Thermoplasmata archaeon HGW-Thermoplasmata-1]|nr:MAG: hypothetical protein CVT48_04625 [Thermoplasmata archaeon HGW-Thermoplasmata-1]